MLVPKIHKTIDHIPINDLYLKIKIKTIISKTYTNRSVWKYLFKMDELVFRRIVLLIDKATGQRPSMEQTVDIDAVLTRFINWKWLDSNTNLKLVNFILFFFRNRVSKCVFKKNRYSLALVLLTFCIVSKLFLRVMA